jgi:hypothetical protein
MQETVTPVTILDLQNEKALLVINLEFRDTLWSTNTASPK